MTAPSSSVSSLVSLEKPEKGPGTYTAFSSRFKGAALQLRDLLLT